MGNTDPVDVVANVATGGLYGAGKSAYDVATGQESPLAGVTGGLNQLGPFGGAVYPISPQAAMAGNLIGAGAGVGAGGLGGGGFGSATPATLDPVYFGFDEATLASLGTTPYGAFASGVPSAGLIGAPAAALTGAAAGGSGLGAATGAMGGSQLATLLGGASPLLGAPTGGGFTGSAGTGQLTPQQLAALSAMQSEQHRGLAPTFEQRMKGQPITPGIAGSGFSQ